MGSGRGVHLLLPRLFSFFRLFTVMVEIITKNRKCVCTYTSVFVYICVRTGVGKVVIHVLEFVHLSLNA